MRAMLPVARAIVYEAVLGVILVVGLLALVLEVLPPGPLLVEWLQVPGFFLAVLGGALWLWATVELVLRGDGTPFPLDPPRRLVVSGPYRAFRNPMHVGLVAFFLGEALLFRSATLLAIVAVAAILLGWWIVRGEEPGLLERHGWEYEKYRETVPRWAPSPARVRAAARV